MIHPEKFVGVPPKLPSGGRLPRLIAVDIDGTVLGDGKVVSERTRAALAEAHAGGTEVVIATGRPLRTAAPVSEQLGIVDTIIAYNGAALTHHGEYHLVRELNRDAALEVIARLRAAYPEATLCIERRDGWFLEPNGTFDPSEPTGNAAHVYRGGPPTGVGPLEQFMDEPIIKLNALHETLHPSELVKELGGLDLVGMWSLPFLLEVHDKSVDKSTALKWLCEQHGISPTEVATFGDQQNDAGMLAWAGVGVAMGNAEPEALAVADVQTASNLDDGVALVVESWLRG